LEIFYYFHPPFIFLDVFYPAICIHEASSGKAFSASILVISLLVFYSIGIWSVWLFFQSSFCYDPSFSVL